MTKIPKIILALDIGERRVGMAMARSDTRLPQPHGAMARSDQWEAELQRYIRQNEVAVLVIGLPRGLDGQDTTQTRSVRRLAEQLKQQQLPIYLQDESLTSVKAEEELRSRRVRYNKADVDALAATYILEDFLEQHPEV